jgi:hypothetical protein
MHTVKKQARRERADGAEGFAAIQLLHDPQVALPCTPPFSHGAERYQLRPAQGRSWMTAFAVRLEHCICAACGVGMLR